MQTEYYEFLFALAMKLEERARDTEQRIQDMDRLARDSNEPEFLGLAEQLSGKANEILTISLETYQRAKTIGGAIDHEKLHSHLGSVLLAMGRTQEAFNEFDAIGSTHAAASGWRQRVVGQTIGAVTSPSGYQRARDWLIKQKRICGPKQSDKHDVRSANLMLVRNKYWSAGQADAPRPVRLPSIETPLTVSPILIDADAKLYPSESQWEVSHPLFKQYLPAMRERIKNSMGVVVPRILFRPHETIAIENAYIISINEVPLVLGTVKPDFIFCPDYDEASYSLKSDGDSLERAFNPLTGGQDGVWVGKSYWPEFQNARASLWHYFEYIVRHLERVLRVNLSSFLGVQEVDQLLHDWQGADQQRKKLVQNVSDSQAKVRFVQVLQGLVKEEVPVIDLFAILEAVGMSGQKAHITDLIEAARFAIRDKLPGNDDSFERLFLSDDFEKEVKDAICEMEGKKFLAIEPETTQALLHAFRSAVEGREQARLTVVVRNEASRPFVKRLIELEFPRIGVLSLKELNEGLRNKPSATVEYVPSDAQS